MAYATPELMRIGSAQNIVLADVSQEPGCFKDNPDDPTRSQLDELW